MTFTITLYWWHWPLVAFSLAIIAGFVAPRLWDARREEAALYVSLSGLVFLSLALGLFFGHLL